MYCYVTPGQWKDYGHHSDNDHIHDCPTNNHYLLHDRHHNDYEYCWNHLWWHEPHDLTATCHHRQHYYPHHLLPTPIYNACTVAATTSPLLSYWYYRKHYNTQDQGNHTEWIVSILTVIYHRNHPCYWKHECTKEKDKDNDRLRHQRRQHY